MSLSAPRRSPRRPHPLSLFVFSSLLLALAPTPACNRPNPQVKAHVEAAARLSEQGQVDQALAELEQAQEIEPENVDIQLQIARVLLRDRRIGPAVDYLERAYQLDPRRTGAALQAAELLVERRPRRALALCDSVLEAAPANARAHALRARALDQLRRPEAALESARHAVELQPSDGENQLVLGRVISSLVGDRPPQPEDVYTEGVEAYTAAAESLMDRRQTQALLERANLLSRWPNHVEEAHAAYSALLDRTDEVPGSRSPVGGEAAAFARRTGDDELLERALRVLVAGDPSCSSGWKELASVVDRRGGDGSALIESALEGDASNPDLHVVRASWMAEHGMLDEGLKKLEAAAGQGIAPDQLLETAVLLQIAAGRIDGAQATLGRLVREHPDAPGTLRAQARLALRTGNPGRAREILEDLVARQPDAASLQLLALARYQTKRYPAAIEALEAATKLSPDFDAQRERLAIRGYHEAAQPQRVLDAAGLIVNQGFQLTPADELMRAQSLYLLSEHSAADALLEHIVALDPPLPAAVGEYAARHRAEDPQRVREIVERARARRPLDPTLLYTQIELERSQGRSAEGLDLLERHVAAGGRLTLPLLLARAELLTDLDRLEEAERDVMAMLQRVPGSREAVRALITVYRKMGRLDTLTTSFDAAAESGALGTQGDVLAARIHVEMGDYEVAVARLEPLLADAAPDTRSAERVDLARCLAELGRDLPRALELAQQGFDMMGRDAEAHMALGLAHLRTDQPLKAEAYLRRAVELERGAGRPTATALLLYGQDLRALDRPDEAREAFEGALALDANLEPARAALDGLSAAAKGNAS